MGTETGKEGFVRRFLTEFLNWIRSGLESDILPQLASAELSLQTPAGLNQICWIKFG
jgi:hypothetical protein